MDDLDRKLVALLSRDARASVTALAKALDVSRGTILNRMARMEMEADTYDRVVLPEGAEER